MKIIKETIVTRVIPKNLKEKDQDLFRHEYVLKVNSVEEIVYKNVTIDFFGRILKFCGLINNPIAINKHKIKWVLKEIFYIYFRRKTKHMSTACWITNEWSINYAHWITEILPKIEIIERNFSDCKLLLPIDIYEIGFVKESLDIFNINVETLRIYEKAKVKKMIYIPELVITGNYIPTLMDSVRSRITSNFFPYKKDKLRLYISRKNAGSRRILNEIELLDLLKNYNFKIAFLEDLNFGDEVRLFQNTELLLAVHGAGLTNMFWMGNEANIIELRRFDDNVNNCFFSLASALKLNYYYLLCQVDDLNKQTQQNDFYVDINELSLLLKQIIWS